jgi:hypothetical protein
MSISPVSSSGSFGTYQADYQQSQNTFQQLTQALQSGNLTAAQSAFSALTQKAPPPAANANTSTPSSSNPMAADFQALGQALQSGNLTGAQAAFTKLQSDAQAAQGAQSTHKHHHHHGNDDSSSTTGSASTSSSGSVIGSLLNVLG